MDSLSEAMQLHQNRNFAKAENLYRDLLKNGQSDVKIHHYLADCLLQQQKVMDALDIAENGLKISPEYTELLVFVSQLYWGTNQREKAIERFEKVAQLNATNLEMLFNLGSMYFEERQFDNAIKTFQKIIEIQPNQAQAYFNIGMVQTENTNYEEAIKTFQEGLKYAPNNTFGNTQLGMALHVSGKESEAITYYETAFAYAISDVEKLELLILQGNAHRDLNNTEEAVSFYDRALALDPNNAVAKDNKKFLVKKTIPSWHFSMLADRSRNDAYNQAIVSAVKPGDVVLDIGAGSGLLSLMAARAGSTDVTAVEMVPELAEVAQKVVADNNFSDIIKVHQKRSTGLIVGEDLPEKADIVVSEILDAGLLGEGVIPSLRHAWSNLLKRDAICIPKAADIYAVLIQSDEYKLVSPVKEIQGFDLSAFNHFRDEKAYIVKQSSQVKTEQLSDVFPVMNINFYQLPKQTTEQQPNRYPLEISITKDGKLHGVMFWFTLHVDDQIHMSTGPNGELVHWGQAIFMFEEEKEVKTGDAIKITALQSESVIRFTLD